MLIGGCVLKALPSFFDHLDLTPVSRNNLEIHVIFVHFHFVSSFLLAKQLLKKYSYKNTKTNLKLPSGNKKIK